MEQDFQTLLERAKANLRVIPLGGSSTRATGFDIRLDGGAFELHLYDVRESSSPRPPGPIEQWETVEVGRFILSPLALVRLIDNANAAVAAYETVVGYPIPPEQQFNERLTAIGQQAIGQAVRVEKDAPHPKRR